MMKVNKDSVRSSIPVEQFYRGYLGEPKSKSSKGSTYFCCFHDDKKTPNLFVNNEGLFHCFACGQKGDIFTFYQKVNQTSFKETLECLAEEYGVKEKHGHHSSKKIIIATYAYEDEMGTLLFEAVKFNPKDFLQRSPDGKGGWKWNLKGVRRVLYRLPELLSSKGQVFITEGEKDADLLRGKGLTATTCAMGAGKWKHEYSEWLKGRDVVILPDNDAPGRSHAKEVANSLNGIASSVKVVGLPSLQEHGDVSDYLDMHTIEELLTLVESSPFYDHSQIEIGEPASVDDSDWDAPVMPGKHATPEIPSSLLPGWLGEYVDAVSRNAQTPSGLAVMMGLATLATCVQKRFEISPFGDDYTEPLSYWALVALPPGSRKTSVVGAMTAPLSEWELEQRNLTEIQRCEVETRRNVDSLKIDKLERDASKTDDHLEKLDLIRKANQLKADMPDSIPTPRLWTGDVTPERLQDLMAEQKERMGVLSDEGGIFEVMAGLYNDGRANIDIFLQAHAGRPVRVDRGSRTVYMQRPALSFGLAVQPEVLKGLGQGGKKKFRGLGALARFHYLFPKSNIGSRDMSRRDCIPATVKAEYHDQILRLLNIEPIFDESGVELPRLLRLSEDALSSWLKFSQYIESHQGEGGKFECIQDWTGKLPGAALRIAGLLHVTTNDENYLEVSSSTVERAQNICELLIPHALYTFNQIGADSTIEDARVVLSWIQKESVEVFKRSECHRALHGRFPKVERLKEALEVLRGWNVVGGSEKIKGKSNRSSHIYRVNPSLSGEN